MHLHILEPAEFCRANKVEIVGEDVQVSDTYAHFEDLVVDAELLIHPGGPRSEHYIRACRGLDKPKNRLSANTYGGILMTA